VFSGRLSAALPPLQYLKRLRERITLRQSRESWQYGHQEEKTVNMTSTGILPLIAPLILAIMLTAFAAVAQAECSGCLCPGNPCKLCPLPPAKNASSDPEEPDTCLKIRQRVPPVSANTDPDEHYASLDKSIMECVRNGGDVVMNSRRNKEFPSKHYCKPYIAPGKAKVDGGSSPGKN
jgi:hypothetical protein